jgi:hypothetical protein
MKINYNVDHRLLNLDLFTSDKPEDKMTSLQRLITFNLLSMIVHFTKHAKDKKCQVWLKQIAEDFDCDRRYLTKAMKHLQRYGYIKIVVPYNRKTQQGAWVHCTPGLCTIRTKQVHNTHKAGVPSTQVNNYEIIINHHDDDFDKSSRVNDEPSLTIEERKRLQALKDEEANRLNREQNKK